MKQHITEKQINELSETELDKLYYFTGSLEDDGIKLLSIGEMIEFLDSFDLEVNISKPHLTQYDVSIYDKYTDRVTLKPNLGFYQSEELCDALWEAVKEALKEL
ncbi:MAG: hypothetical protein WC215_05400 [Bacilli bacterium]|jgi:hypothetical protein